MGIQGLLPFLKEIQRDVHISSFRGRRVAVDAYCWLHRGAYSCAMQLVMNTERFESLPFIKYCMKRVQMLLNYNITPVMVFDGGYLPLKARTESERRERRQVNREKGKALLREGKRSEAFDCFQRSVDISPEMAHALIKECRGVGVECIVAPYEADAQLAYLCKEGIVDLVITEDSDLLVFGCQQVMFKMDDSGNGKLVEMSQLGKANRGLVGFTVDSFRHMCILSGCDYLASVPGIGLGKSLKFMKRFNKDPYRVIKALHLECGSKVPPEYEVEFRKADQTFLYQLVFDPRSQQQVRLNSLPGDQSTSNFEFAGVEHSPNKAVGMARGNINPFNHAVMDSYSPSKAASSECKALVKSSSWGVTGGRNIWGKSLIPRPPSSLTSSESIWRHFKPPKKLKPKPEEAEEGVDAVEDLQTTYLTATMSSSLSSSNSTADSSNPTTVEKALGDEMSHGGDCQQPEEAGGGEGGGGGGSVETKSTRSKSLTKPSTTSTTSRFFSTLSSTNREPHSSSFSFSSSSATDTPTDGDVAKILRAKRRLALLPENTSNITINGKRGSCELSDDEMMAERCELRRKKLRSVSRERGTRASLRRFAYDDSAAKKRRRCSSSGTDPLSQLDQDNSFSSTPSQTDSGGISPVTPSRVRNPFAKSQTTPTKTTHPPPLLVSGERDEEEEEDGVFGSNLENNSCNTVHDNSGTSAQQQQQEEEDNEGNSEAGTTTSENATPAGLTNRPFMTSEDFITTRSHSTLLDHLISLAPSKTEQDSSLSGCPSSTNKTRTLGTRRQSLSLTKSKSKSSGTRNNKAPKRLEPTQTQLTLRSRFSYCPSHPKMNREQ